LRFPDFCVDLYYLDVGRGGFMQGPRSRWHDNNDI
jgi:hypothetical protein